MHEHDQDDQTDPVVDETDPVVEGDAELDGLAADLDTVEAALQALDADDLDQAETLAASLGGRDTGATADDPPAPDPSSAPA